MPRPFHVAFPVRDLSATRAFYEAVLGCAVGRTDSRWIDFNLFGHQVTAHLVDDTPEARATNATNLVDGKAVPTQHWGVILEMNEWEALADRLRSHGVEFIIEPYIRFKGEVGEQATMFLLDPSGNALEFKAFADDAAIFATS
ncbi:VOC family protein [Thermoleptolyngbya sp. C42_A2020_037]|uniref:VOC family protein n=1 Tax=Thermoleptolyngbya sp. C42_A2020_037 TaxID=2747799 RepID=UPI001A0893C6|nr:VOC family protein [Thermoleptolyngbya sp. C42_A2020_037]MBF2084502.1 VOC family protein [Thermoleptolyngbya sp. C42_A2020_037]